MGIHSRRFAAQAGILLILGGIPYALYALAGNPLPDRVPSWSQVAERLTAHDDGTLFLAALTWAGWIGWASFAVPLLIELMSFALRRRAPHIAGLSWQQRRAAALVAAALAIGATPAVASADAQPISAAPAVAAPAVAASATAPTYVVERADWLYHVASRFLGDGDRYPEIAALNPDLERADPRFPDHIEANQRVQLPPDAHDRGARAHARGTLAAVAQPPPAAPSEPPPVPSPVPSEPAPSPSAELSHEQEGDTSLDAVLPVTAALATAGLLAALVIFHLTRRRQRQRQHRRPGRRIPQPSDPVVERRVRSAAQPVDVNRLDHVLRALAVALRDRTQDKLPDLAAVWLSGGDVHLMLAEADPVAPPPFQTSEASMTWTLSATADVPEVDDALAPLPTLVAVASRPGGDHLLIDLERAGLLGIGGDPTRAADLLRYIVAELATNQWSDDAEVVIAGFHPEDAESLVELGGGRVTTATSVSEAVHRAGRRADTNAAAMSDAGVPSAFAGRVGDFVADAWMPHVLLIADAEGADNELRELEVQLERAGRCAVAAAVISAATRWRIDVTTAGTLAVDWLSVTNATASRLPREQLTRLASVMRAARATLPVDEPVPAATEQEPWAEGTDAQGHLIDMGEVLLAREEERPEVVLLDQPASAHTDALTSTRPVIASTFTQVKRRPAARSGGPNDTELDADIEAWYRPDRHRPRVAVLGPVVVEAPGEPPEERIRFYSELVVYLAQRGGVGATGEQIDDALWPDRRVNARSRRVAISKARRWLGETADGTQWLPPNVGSDRLYRLLPGALLDWQLFRRLRARGEARGADGAEDLRRALDLVRGEPLAGAELPYSSGYRNPYTWLPGSDIQPHNLASAVVDTAHQLVRLCLEAGDTAGARRAVDQAWLADPARLDDHPWIDAMRVARADGRSAELRALFDDLVRTREVEVPEDLSPDTYAAINDLIGELLRSR
ncbi:bacterial transcriptional activator domain-containing protein [Dactylosporangium sp. AC04546]|uniref:bacterial transcriptional activator domain-containing protein n=1 Tax=Dactylosporangium sp. AC04546 TaxID=2862460 RepID=UPI001EDCA3B5|nr:bacterial transcriptional activator domain-containing protein [Dactylosporangium sp. AC04546]WVK80406.1 bacterial transcriptional activator domain-containing protein [Dactylosporangium sp. AC04546]